MLVATGSVKGSPGVTSTALALAAVWPRPAVLLEADPAGGDLAYRCRAAHGGPVFASTEGLVHPCRGGPRRRPRSRMSLVEQAQLLACGVDLVQGVSCAGAGRGLGSLWSTIAEACTASEVDVIADLGRLDRTSAGDAARGGRGLSCCRWRRRRWSR